jgi:hypothetical protein
LDSVAESRRVSKARKRERERERERDGQQVVGRKSRTKMGGGEKTE